MFRDNKPKKTKNGQSLEEWTSSKIPFTIGLYFFKVFSVVNMKYQFIMA